MNGANSRAVRTGDSDTAVVLKSQFSFAAVSVTFTGEVATEQSVGALIDLILHSMR